MSKLLWEIFHSALRKGRVAKQREIWYFPKSILYGFGMSSVVSFSLVNNLCSRIVLSGWSFKDQPWGCLQRAFRDASSTGRELCCWSRGGPCKGGRGQDGCRGQVEVSHRPKQVRRCRTFQTNWRAEGGTGQRRAERELKGNDKGEILLERLFIHSRPCCHYLFLLLLKKGFSIEKLWVFLLQEERMRRERDELLQRLTDSESRHEELSGSVSTATRPLLR